MKRNLLKTILVAVGMAAGTTGAWADGTWSAIFSEDYNDASTYDKFWTSAITGRYTISQTARTSGEAGDYVMEVVPVSNGNNGTTATYTGLTTSNNAVDAYQTADLFRVSFEFNFCYNSSQSPFFQIMNSSGTEVVGFYSSGTSSADGTVRLGAGGTNTGGAELGTFTLSAAAKTPTTYNKVVIYTQEVNGTKGTYMDVTWAGSEAATTYTIDAANIVHIGKLVHNTKRYYNHFVFDNLKVELYSESEIVAAPQASITAINGTNRTITIVPQDASHAIYYYLGDEDSNPIEYKNPVVVSETSVLHYYAQSASGATSDIQKLEVNCVPVTLSAPTWLRTGATSYTITATQEEVDGLIAVPTIHYTIAGGAEQTIENGGTINDVSGDVEAWAVSDGYTDSEKTIIDHVVAYQTIEIWSYNLNSFPSDYGITSISEAINTETETTLNEKTVYNLKNIEKPDLFVENSTGWLLRNQTSNAFKIQNSSTSLTFNNVAPGYVIYINGVDDNGRYRIGNVVNGEVKYSYSNREYFIVPTVEGAVSVTFNTGVSINVVSVSKMTETVSVTSAGLATYCPSVALDFSSASNVAAYKAVVNDDNASVTLTKLDYVAAGEGVLLRSLTNGATEENIPVASGIEKNAGNAFVGTDTDLTIYETSEDGTTTNYVLSKEGDVVGFFKAAKQENGGTQVGAGKAYLPVSTTAAAKGITFTFNGETTGISEIAADIKAAGNDVYYTISGVRVQNPTKGMYIKNGKKVVVK